jgi:hypothetical protein
MYKNKKKGNPDNSPIFSFKGSLYEEIEYYLHLNNIYNINQTIISRLEKELNEAWKKGNYWEFMYTMPTVCRRYKNELKTGNTTKRRIEKIKTKEERYVENLKRYYEKNGREFNQEEYERKRALRLENNTVLKIEKKPIYVYNIDGSLHSQFKRAIDAARALLDTLPKKITIQSFKSKISNNLNKKAPGVCQYTFSYEPPKK